MQRPHAASGFCRHDRFVLSFAGCFSLYFFLVLIRATPLPPALIKGKLAAPAPSRSIRQPPGVSGAITGSLYQHGLVRAGCHGWRGGPWSGERSGQSQSALFHHHIFSSRPAGVLGRSLASYPVHASRIVRQLNFPQARHERPRHLIFCAPASACMHGYLGTYT